MAFMGSATRFVRKQANHEDTKDSKTYEERSPRSHRDTEAWSAFDERRAATRPAGPAKQAGPSNASGGVHIEPSSTFVATSLVAQAFLCVSVTPCQEKVLLRE